MFHARRMAVAGLAVALTMLGLVVPVAASAQAADSTPITKGTPVTIDFDQPHQRADYTFAGEPGQYVVIDVGQTDLQGFPDTGYGVNFVVSDPDGSYFDSFGPAASPQRLTDDQTLRSAGSWKLAVVPDGEITGKITFTLTTEADQVLAVTPGQPQAVTYQAGARNVRLTFPAHVGQRLTLGVTASDLSSPGGYAGQGAVDASALSPEGGALGLGQFAGTGYGEVYNTPVDVDGTWTVVLDPEEDTIGTQTVTVGLVTDVSGSVEVGEPTAVSLTDPGQTASYTFDGVEGQTLIAGLDAARFTSGSDGGDPTPAVEVMIADPAGDNHELIAPGADYGEFVLKQTGSYIVKVDPLSDTVGTATLSLRYSQVATSSLTLDATTTASLQRGDKATYTFPGTTGRRLGLQITTIDWSPTGSSGSVRVQVLRPDGSEFFSSDVDAPQFLETKALDTTGTWTLELDPIGASAGSLTLVARQPADQVGALTPGTSLRTAIATPGQQARYTFTGIAGRIPVLDSSATHWSAGATATATLYRPDGSKFAAFDPAVPYPTPRSASSWAEVNLLPDSDGLLDASGTWTLVIDPAGAAVGSQTFTFSQLPVVDGGSLTLGRSKPVSVRSKGSQVQYSFSWDGHGFLNCSMDLGTFKAGTPGTVSLRNQYGVIGTANFDNLSSTGFGFAGFDVAGPHTLRIDPTGVATGTLSITCRPGTEPSGS